MLSDSISFVIPGAPVPKGRARSSSAGGFVRAYTPQKTAAAENNVKAHILQKIGLQVPYKDLALRVDIRIYIPYTQAIAKSKKKIARVLADELIPTTKPDIDNYVKTVLDACKGLVFKDDALIAELTAIKRYSDRPRLEIDVKVIGGMA